MKKKGSLFLILIILSIFFFAHTAWEYLSREKDLPKKIEKTPNRVDVLCHLDPAYSPTRCLPFFLILGAQKAATTSYFKWLSHHPQILFPAHKELHFFDTIDSSAISGADYFDLFPLIQLVEHGPGPQCVTGEATPIYLFHPHIPQVVKKIIPSIKNIILLRDPVDRAWSGFKQTVQTFFRVTPFPFPNQTDIFERLVTTEIFFYQNHAQNVKNISNPWPEVVKLWMKFVSHDELVVKFYQTCPKIVCNYILRGLYDLQILNWSQYFPLHTFIFLITEETLASTTTIVESLHSIENFFGISEFNWDGIDFSHKYNPSNQNDQLSSAIRQTLQSFFAPSISKLEQLLKKDLTLWRH